MLTNRSLHKPTRKTWYRSPHPMPSTSDWRCTTCDILLGVHRDGRMHLRHGRNHEYFVTLPVQATCRDCGQLNDARSPNSG